MVGLDHAIVGAVVDKEGATLVISALTLIAAGVAALFGYPAWRESRTRPLLRISLRPDSNQLNSSLTVVDNSGKGQIVFILTLHNDGNREARYWRIWFAGKDKDMTIYLSSRAPHEETRSFTGPSFIGGRWVTEVAAGSAADIVSHEWPLTLPGRHTINIPLDTKSVRLDYRLDADRMPTRKGIVRLEIDRGTRTVRAEYDTK